MTTYRMGAGQIDPAGFKFEWDEDDYAAPSIRDRDRVVTAGRTWMRVHAPTQWAAFIAARLLGSLDVAILPEMERYPIVLRSDTEFEPQVIEKIRNSDLLQTGHRVRDSENRLVAIKLGDVVIDNTGPRLLR